MYLLTNERYITYQMGFPFGRLGHAQGWDLGVPWVVGDQKFFFPKFNQIWCVSYSHEWHMHQHNFFLSPPSGALGGGGGGGGCQKFNFAEHGHVAYQIKGDEQ